MHGGWGAKPPNPQAMQKGGGSPPKPCIALQCNPKGVPLDGCTHCKAMQPQASSVGRVRRSMHPLHPMHPIGMQGMHGMQGRAGALAQGRFAEWGWGAKPVHRFAWGLGVGGRSPPSPIPQPPSKAMHGRGSKPQTAW